MNKKRMTIVAAVLLVTASMVFAAGSSESGKLWFQANKVADASSYFVAGSRTLQMNVLDAAGKTVQSSSVSIDQSPYLFGRYIDQQAYGDTSILDITSILYDGGIITPFENELYDMAYAYLGTETVEGKACAVYEAALAMDKALITYTPAYVASGTLEGWSTSDDDFNGKIMTTVWLDQATGAIVKLQNNWTLDNIPFVQTVSYTNATVDGVLVSVPNTIVTTGSISQRQVGSGYNSVTNFQIIEKQDDFFYDAKFVRGVNQF